MSFVPPAAGTTFLDVTSSPLGDSGDGTGVAWGDYDNDGDLDLYLSNSGSPSRLYRNDGGSTFADVTTSPLNLSGPGRSVAWADYDNDGNLDLYTSTDAAGNHLFRNLGGGSFSDVTSGPLSDGGPTHGFGWADYDRDGDVDLLIANTSGGTNRLLRNDGGSGFVNVTPPSLGTSGNGVAWADYDNDGDLDVYLSKYAGGINKLLRNDGGTILEVPGGPLEDAGSGRGMAWGDYDNDGNLDLYLVNSGANKLFHNNGNGTFSDVTTGPLGDTDSGNAAGWADYDNDGDLDLYFTNDFTGGKLLRNDGGGNFIDANSLFADNSGRAFGMTWGDYDRDGDLDLFGSYLGADKLFRNETAAAGNHWLHVSLVGVVSNRSAIGARVRVVTGGLRQIREVSGSTGYYGQESLPVEFGLGSATTIDSLIVRWPNGIQQVVTPVPAVNQAVTVVEGAFVDVTSGPLGDTGYGQGVAWGDYDNDGDIDLYVANGGALGPQANKMFRNDGGGTFVDATSGPLGDNGQGFGVTWGDYDNDGDLDLYLSNLGANRLFRNDGGGSFVDATGGPLGDIGSGNGVAWGDYDNDGDLDLYLVNNGANKLFRNDGGGAFVDATTGPLGDTGIGTCVAGGDYDNDGDLDLYIANNGANKLFRNEGGGAFVDATSGPLGDTGTSNGVAWGDYDNDSDLDLYLVNFNSANKLFRNDGGGTFVDATTGPLGDNGPGIGVAWGDYDNDGDLDLYVSNYGSPNRILRNEGSGAFVDATAGAPGVSGQSFGVAWGDYDNDGDLDLYLASGGANQLFRNEAAVGQHWLEIKLQGTASNRAGIGARVRIVSGGVNQIREISGGSGYLSQDAPMASFGLGSSTMADSLIVRWPSGLFQTFTSVAVDQVLNVVENEGWVDVSNGVFPSEIQGGHWGDYDGDGDPDLFATRENGNNRLYRNDSGAFVDVTPASLLSPAWTIGAAWADYDNDGDLDLYVAGFGGTGSPGQLFRNDGPGIFADVTSGELGGSSASMGVSWVDYDNDSDLDIYVSNVNGDGNKLLRNDGGDIFTDATSGPLGETLPTWVAAWGDYDNDGDMDVYLPNDNAPNKLLRNDGNGVFADVTSTPLDNAGGARSAVWGDYDADGDVDLFLGVPSQSDRLFRNDSGGAFADMTASPLDDIGSSNGAAWGDYDNDGALDLVLARFFGDTHRLYRNNDDGTFSLAASGPLGVLGTGGMPSWADYDLDGDLDLFMPQFGPARLFRNDTPGANHWLHVKLIGTVSNATGIGARIRLVTGGRSQLRQLSPSGSTSQSDLTVAFGAGPAVMIDTLEVRWPSGRRTVRTTVPVDQTILVREPTLYQVPSSFPTIQAAIDATVSGDTVLVAPGTYTGPGNRDLAIGGKSILLSHAGMVPAQAGLNLPGDDEPVVIDCQGLGREMTLNSSSVVRGITITGGVPPAPQQNGGALLITGASPAFERCILVGNFAPGTGGGVAATLSSSPAFTSCTIAANRAGLTGGGINIVSNAVSLTRCIVWGNCANSAGGEVFVQGTSVIFTCSDVDSTGTDEGPGGIANYAGGTIFTNPRFCLPDICSLAPQAGGKFGLASSSPALPANNACGQLMGALDQECVQPTAIWTGEGDATSWEDDFNWAAWMEPQNGNNVVISDVSQTSEVLVSTSSVSIDSLTSRESLRLVGGAIDVQATSTSTKLTIQSGATLGGGGTVTVDTLIWSGGVMDETGTTRVNQALILDGSVSKDLRRGRVLQNAGTATWPGSGPLRHGEGEAGTRFENLNSGAFTIAGQRVMSHINGAGSQAAFLNAGRLALTVDSTTTIEASFTNAGTLAVDAGTVDLTLGLTNFAGRKLTSGTYDIKGTLKFFGAAIDTCAARVILDGPPSQIIDEFSGDAVDSLKSNVTQGDFTIQNGRNLSVAGGLSNAGAITVAPSCSLSVTGTYTQSGGVTTTQGTLTADTLSVEAGLIKGSGTLNTTMVNRGILRPGPGVLTISANYEQTAEGALEIELGGYVPGTQFDFVQVAGTASLAGLLQVELINSFYPAVADTFTFMTASSMTGVFGSAESFGLIIGVPMTSTAARISISGLHPRFSGPDGGSWFSTSNWIGGMPGDNHDVRIDRKVVIGSGSAHARKIRIADSGSLQGELQLSGGTLTATALEIKPNSGGALTLNSPGSIVTLHSVNLDSSTTLNWYAGTVEISGGSWTQKQSDLDIGIAAGTSLLRVRNGAAVNIPGTTRVGAEPGSQSTVVVDGSASVLKTGILRVGDRGTGALTLINGGRDSTGLGGEPGAATVVGPSGTLSGNGTIQGSVVNGGLVSPGMSAGVLNVSGNYIQTTAGTTTTQGVLQIEVGGASAGQYDQLFINGQASLGGTLRIVALSNSLFIPYYLPPLEVVTFGGRGGTVFNRIVTWPSPNAPSATESLLVNTTYDLTSAKLSSLDVVGAPEATPIGLFSVYPNFPNPARTATTIRFELPVAEKVTIRIYDVMGRLVRTLSDQETFEAGRGERIWDTRSDSGTAAASGMYFYSVQAGGVTKSRRMILIR